MKENRITIRNIDPEVLEEAREIVRTNRHETMGTFFSDALAAYIEMLPEEEEDSVAV